MRKFSLCSHKLTLGTIDCTLQRCHTKWTSIKGRNSQALRWKHDGIGCNIKYRQDGSTLHRQRNQGRYYRENLLQNCFLPSEIQWRLRISRRWCYVAPCEVDSWVSAAERYQLHWAFCLATKQSRSESCWLCCLRRSIASCVQSSDRGCGWFQGQSVHLLGQPRPTTHQQSRWSLATAIKSSSSSLRTAHWTVLSLLF